MVEERKKIPQCKACGSDMLTLKYDMGEWQVWRCIGCDFIFVHPLQGTVLGDPVDDRHTVETHHLYREELMLSARIRVKELMEFLGDLKGLNVLDVGCGNGYFLRCCKDQGMRVQGLEINEAAARYARTELGISVLATLHPYDKALETTSFDVITLWGVIEHLDDPGNVVASVRNLLKDGGIFVIQTPTEDALVRRMTHAWNKIMHKKSFVGSMYINQRGAHIQCFSRQSIREFLSRRGFRVLKIKDSTYGKKYMLKKPIFMRDTLSSKALRVGAGFLYDSTRIIGHQNHMLVFSGKIDQESV